MLELRRSPARPRQAVIVAADFRIILRSPHGDQIELGLVLHVSLEPFGRLSAIAGGPAAAIDLAQNIFRRYRVILDLDVLEHLVREAELAGEQIHRVVVVFRFEHRLDDLLAPLQRAVRGGTRPIHLEAGAGRQKIRAVLALREHRPCGRIGIADDQQFELLDAAHRFRHSRDGVDAMPHDEHRLHRLGLADLVFRQQGRIEPARARECPAFPSASCSGKRELIHS